MSKVPLSVITPWGPSHSLRERTLPPGPGTPAEQVAENQRQRLFGAMVASVAERGYGATRVADLTRISGVSSRSFYDLFPDKQACFVAALEVLLAETAADEGFDAFAERIVAEPAAARLCLIDAFAAGPEASRLLELTIGRAEASVRERLAGSPAQMPTVMVGAVLELTRSRLLHGEDGALPAIGADLAELLLAYRPPTKPLRLGGRPPVARPEAPEAHDHAERGLRAFEALVAEQGYVETTMEQVARRAAMSPKTLYANFDGKQDVLLAAVESAGAQIVAAVMPAFRRNAIWAEGVRAALGALFSLLASRPEMARLVMDELFAGGPPALERRAQALRPLWSMLAAGRHYSPQTPALAPEAILAGVLALCRKAIRDSGPQALPGLVPVATYVALTPFLGAEEATAAANGEGPRRGTEKRELAHALAAEPSSGHMLVVLSEQAASPREIAAKIGKSPAKVVDRLEELFKAGLVAQVGERRNEREVEPIYAATGGLVETEQWASVSLEERRRISTEIRELIAAEVERSVENGSFDARTDRYLVRVPFLADQQGWQEVGDVMDAALRRCLDIRAKSSERLKETGGEAISARAVMTLFEMPATPE